MSAPFSDVQEPVIFQRPPSTEGPLSLSVDRVLPGMFVSDLDRPWAETPFPTEGFIVRDEYDVVALRQHSRRVQVDPLLSEPGILAALRAASILDYQPPDIPGAPIVVRPPGPDYPQPATGRLIASRPAEVDPTYSRARDDLAISQAPLERLKAALALRNPAPLRGRRRSSLLRMIGLSSLSPALGLPTSLADSPAAEAMLALQALYGRDVGFTSYPAPEPMATVVNAARAAYRRCETVLGATEDTVRQGGVVRTAELFEAVIGLTECVIRSPQALTWVHRIRAQDVAPSAAPMRMYVAILLLLFGRDLGLSRPLLSNLAMAGLLCDIGMLRLPRAIVNKPGVLDRAEFEIVRGHLEISLEILSRSGDLPGTVLEAVAQHHERLDGSGYPRGLQQNSIGLAGRMIAIADCFAALTSSRAYANGLSCEDALNVLYGWAPAQFCPTLLEQFAWTMGLYPVGTLVELERGEIAVIIDRDLDGGAPSKVLVLTAPDKGPLRPIVDRAGSQEPDEFYAGTRVVIRRGLPAGAFGLVLRDYFARPEA